MNQATHPNTSPYSESIDDEPQFIPAIHLALDQPERVLTLSDLGYAEQASGVPTEVAKPLAFECCLKKA